MAVHYKNSNDLWMQHETKSTGCHESWEENALLVNQIQIDDKGHKYSNIFLKWKKSPKHSWTALQEESLSQNVGSNWRQINKNNALGPQSSKVQSMRNWNPRIWEGVEIESSWAGHGVMVLPKYVCLRKDGTLVLLVKCWKFNAVIVRYSYFAFRMEESINPLRDTLSISTLDANWAY